MIQPIRDHSISKYRIGQNPRIDAYLSSGELWYMVNAEKGIKPILVPKDVKNKQRWAEARYRELFNGIPA